MSYFTWSTRLYARAGRRLLRTDTDGFSTRFSAAERPTRGRTPGCWPACDLLPQVSLRTEFIERFWYSAKHYARENCEYTFVGLRQAPSISFTSGLINHYLYCCRRVLPDALDSVSSASINRYFHHCKRVIEAYEAGEVYGTKEFSDRAFSTRAIGELLIKVNGNFGSYVIIYFFGLLSSVLFYVIT